MTEFERRSGQGAALTDEEIASFNDSLERCTAHEGFLLRFYAAFVASNPEVAAKFRLTDIKKQSRHLQSTLYFVMLAAQGRPEGTMHLQRLAELHGRAMLDIPPAMYDLWLECLIQAVRECDPHLGESGERAWRSTMQTGIDFMKSRY